MDIRSYFGASTSQQLIAVTVKIADQIVPILNYQVPALALHLQRKHVASKVNATLLNPPKESTPKAGRRITVGCIMMRILKVPFARFASSLGRLLMFSVVEECGSLSPSRTGRKLSKK